MRTNPIQLNKRQITIIPGSSLQLLLPIGASENLGLVEQKKGDRVFDFVKVIKMKTYAMC